MLGAVYKIKCLVNNKVYIGQSNNPEHRWKYNHLYDLRRNKHRNRYLQQDFNLYGESMFSYTILEYCETRQKLIERETYYININIYGGINSNKTYNMLDMFTENEEMKQMISNTYKGKPPHNKNKHRSEQARQKYRQYLNSLTPEQKQQINNKRKQTFKEHPEKTWKGRHHTEESKRKISERAKDNRSGKNNGHYGKLKYTIEFIQQLYNDYKITNNYSQTARNFNLSKDSVRLLY